MVKDFLQQKDEKIDLKHAKKQADKKIINQNNNQRNEIEGKASLLGLDQMKFDPEMEKNFMKELDALQQRDPEALPAAKLFEAMKGFAEGNMDLKAYGIDPAQLDKPARVKEAIPNEQVVNVHANKLGKGNKNYSDGNIKSSKKKK